MLQHAKIIHEQVRIEGPCPTWLDDILMGACTVGLMLGCAVFCWALH